jgi:hypothetical protein
VHSTNRFPLSYSWPRISLPASPRMLHIQRRNSQQNFSHGIYSLNLKYKTADCGQPCKPCAILPAALLPFPPVLLEEQPRAERERSVD